MAVLARYLLRDRHIIDEHVWWVNTCDPDDVSFIEQMCAEHPDFFSAHYLDEPRQDLRGTQRVRLIRDFFPRYTDHDTVYVRFDDDICWVAPDAVEELVKFRVDHPEYFLVYPGIINNGRTMCIHAESGVVAYPRDMQPPNGWRERMNLTAMHPAFGETHHESLIQHLIEGTVGQMKFGAVEIAGREQVAINCIAWLGEAFAAFDGRVATSGTNDMEEPWLTTYYPAQHGLLNCIWGGALVAHFAFYTQRRYMEAGNILPMYELVSLGDIPGSPPAWGSTVALAS